MTFDQLITLLVLAAVVAALIRDRLRATWLRWPAPHSC